MRGKVAHLTLFVGRGVERVTDPVAEAGALLQRRGEDHRERSPGDPREGAPVPASGRRGSLRQTRSVRNPRPGNAAGRGH